MSFEAGIFGDFVSPNVTQQGGNVNNASARVRLAGAIAEQPLGNSRNCRHCSSKKGQK
ncbi:hypothetical protein RBSWK_01470 [Rhodopirellula baltica SWK14]|uniref:Uncharacterized protein n=1 Tax=Rhodopirellula baltica SWK14 TaxID=993516 RepID=L7CNE3_RHOBT|nr:hypothetical protein RBSWK_01470 [Rhodopirellula baltica SWK14]